MVRIRRVGKKGQVTIPKDIRDALKITEGTKIVFELPGRRDSHASRRVRKEFVEEWCSLVKEKSREFDLRKLKEEYYELVTNDYYFDANVFLLPQLYEESIEEVRKAKEYLLKLATGEVEACTSVLTWDEVVYIVRRRAGMEKDSIASRKFMSFPNLKIVPVRLRGLRRAF